jgi:hypothetical protein
MHGENTKIANGRREGYQETTNPIWIEKEVTSNFIKHKNRKRG